MTLQVIAMHGWGGDSRAWEPWRQLAEQRGWQWQSGERGYGSLPPLQPTWITSGAAAAGPRVLIGHSLGPHLVPATVLAAADLVVLLASFGCFVPEGRDRRRLQRGLAGMAAPLQAHLTSGKESSERAVQSMLAAFLQQAADPADAALLPPGPESDPITPAGCRRLLDDLERLEHCDGLPTGFPAAAQVLIVEAEADRIVVPAARTLLCDALPTAAVEVLPGAGHSLLQTNVVPLVFSWLETRQCPWGQAGGSGASASEPVPAGSAE
ncbi:alpha/beta fold hydrolase [Synechococcus sp. CBW1006]|uniref:alpha/beta fold hydrolase n=1 Tax=Synechococcus sp. CBW1006 TaxID=1353138 RepID=UPI0018CC841A|nr:alpha/beta hydrolase [Synechococcus sp. CBW1006]QPN66930.1 alpha/beta hydrolase [Synechococcus sp. CBW1006]